MATLWALIATLKNCTFWQGPNLHLLPPGGLIIPERGPRWFKYVWFSLPVAMISAYGILPILAEDLHPFDVFQPRPLLVAYNYFSEETDLFNIFTPLVDLLETYDLM